MNHTYESIFTIISHNTMLLKRKWKPLKRHFAFLKSKVIYAKRKTALWSKRMSKVYFLSVNVFTLDSNFMNTILKFNINVEKALILLQGKNRIICFLQLSYLSDEKHLRQIFNIIALYKILSSYMKSISNSTFVKDVIFECNVFILFLILYSKIEKHLILFFLPVRALITI